jgi:hypothetical protein
MRCLYCGKELALLKRLRGGGDFCSDAHKHSYQEEYNRLALSRLLQAQKKGQKTNSPVAPNTPPPPNASVALEEPTPPVLEETASMPEGAPVLEEDVAEVVTPAPPESATDTFAAEEPSPEVVAGSDGVSAEPEPVDELEPVDTAGFLLENPALAAWPEETPYLEPWLEPSAGPAMSEWPLQNGAAFSLSTADLVSLDLRPGASSTDDRIFSSDLSPQAFSGASPDRLFSALANIKKIVNKNRLPAGGSITIDLAPSAVASAPDQSFVQAIGFESAVLVEQSQLLELSPTAIDFPAADSDVVVLARSQYNGTNGTESAYAELELETPDKDNSPRASLEALSRLHHELVELEAARIEEATTESAPEPMEAVAEVVEAMPVQVIAVAEDVTDQNRTAEPQTVEIKAEEPGPAAEGLKPTEEVLRPKYTTELFDISIRIFPPAKPALIAGEPFPSHIGPLMPHLKSLPLRPKVGLASGYVPPSNTPAPSESKPPVAAAATVRAPSPSKPAPPSGKPATRLTQPKRPISPASQVQAAAKSPGPRAPASPKPVASPPVTVQEPVAAPANAPEVTPKAAPAEKAPAADAIKPAANTTTPTADTTKPAANTVKPTTDTLKPAAQAAKPAQDQAKPRADLARPTADQTKKDNVPSFDIAQPANNSWLGSLKVKLGIAILLLVLACAYFLGWGGGKSHNPAGSNPAGDGSGPSIIMGEGGWVEGWGGDPTGLHAGRQITIYRPSLKLSDYRLAFQASIDAKSVGWVFRASDPNNYYAMKLMTVSSGLSTKVALFKYMVANGKQTQVGRVPIDLAVHPDTVFDVRVDVRGPQFTTYIQGQQVDSWTDDQLKIGGAGFLNEREERGKVKSVSIRYLSGAAK